LDRYFVLYLNQFCVFVATLCPDLVW